MTSQMAQNAERLPPVHPGEILNEEFLLPMNITQYRLAKSIGVDARRIHSIVHGERSITAETRPALVALLRKFGWVLDGSAEPVRPRNHRGPPFPEIGHGDGPLARMIQVARLVPPMGQS